MSEWIKCSDMQPTPGAMVLATWEQFAPRWIFDVVIYHGGDYWHEPENDEDDFIPPSHWMPLPAQPEATR